MECSLLSAINIVTWNVIIHTYLRMLLLSQDNRFKVVKDVSFDNI
jgi:hypothetical protein